VALVIDQTGSMAGSKIANLKLAAKDLIDIVVWDNQTDDYYAKVAIVPYAAGINVGGIPTAPLTPASVRGTIQFLCFLLGCDNFRFLNPSGVTKTYSISTCVSERTGPEKFTDAAPSTALVGKNYPPPSDPCPSNSITPLTNNKTVLKDQIDRL